MVPFQLARGDQTTETTLQIHVQVDRVLSGTAAVNVLRNGTPIGQAARVDSTDVYAYTDVGVPIGTHEYATQVTDGSYVGPISAVYSVQVIQGDAGDGFLALESDGLFLMEDGNSRFLLETPNPEQ